MTTATPFRLGFGVTFSEAIAAAERRKVVLPDTFYGDIPESMRQYAWTVSGVTGIDQVQAVFDSLNAKLASGKSFAEWQAEARTQDWGLSPARLELIARTHAQTAYMAGQWEQFMASAKTRPWLMYSAINDSRTRPAHHAMSGYMARVDDPIWLTWSPPCGYNCRCSLISMTDPQAKDRGAGTQDRPNVLPDPGWGHPPAQAGDRMRTMLAERMKSVPTPVSSVMDRIMAGGYTYPPLEEAQVAFAQEQRDILAIAFGNRYSELSDAEIWALREYATDSFPINAFLRGLKDADDVTMRDAINVQNALRAVADGTQRTLFRGAMSNPRFDKLASEAFVEGRVIRSSAFLSTTTRELTAAEDFADKYFFTISGTSAANVDGFYTVGGENEFVFPAGTNFRVQRVRQVGDVWYIDLVETTEPATFLFSMT